VQPNNSLAGLASIIIPRCDSLEVTRRCITALRRHTRQPWELIVVDDGSSDETSAYLESVRVALGCSLLLILSVMLGQARAAAILRTAFVALLFLNVVPLVLLFVNIHPALAERYTRTELWRGAILVFAGGTLVPLCLMLVGDGPLVKFGAVGFFLLGSLAVRIAYIKIPHTVPLRVEANCGK
jgi:FtsH-binding integral membrane protein